MHREIARLFDSKASGKWQNDGCILTACGQPYPLESRFEPIPGSLGAKAVAVFQHHPVSPIR
ncbi:hypothetical protein [Brumicola nitratireducens]|uniref:hypothetical protein n=1 Tax=Brumicola nitratireducens TaxID=300231 RepID=UPI00031341A0|nr:hypothetical protein [Glaciecola nitratireducens]